MIKAIIIDDEALVRKDLEEKINDHFSKEILIVAQADSVESGLKAIQTHTPDLLLLDIHMPDGTGFDLITRCKQKNFDVIFVTGFDNNAIKAIKVGALDYILKPVAEDELQEAVLKAIENSSRKDKHLEKLIEISQEYLQGVKRKRVILKTTNTMYAIYEDDIVYCRSEGNYTTFYTLQLEKIIVSKSIKKIEEILSPNVFVRCHQSYIVNKKHVLKYNKQGVLIVNLDIKVPVSGRRKEYALKKIFD